MKRRTRRWGRILFNTLTAISLLLAIATAGLFTRSLFVNDQLSSLQIFWDDHRSPRGRSISTDAGKVIYTFLGPFDPDSRYGLNHQYSREPTASFEVDNLWRIENKFQSNGGAFFRFVSIPLTIPLAVALAIPSARVVAFVRGRQSKPGHCRFCGYDTRASPARCSECGQEMPATTKAEGA